MKTFKNPLMQQQQRQQKSAKKSNRIRIEIEILFTDNNNNNNCSGQRLYIEGPRLCTIFLVSHFYPTF